MYKLLISLLFLIFSCRTTKNTSINKSDANWDKMMDKVINQTIQSLTDSGYIK
jgi:hypothetical protein